MRILVIEDENRVATAIKRSLEAKEYAVDIVRESSAAMNAAQRPAYDLIILDRMLPGPYDGLTIAEKLREAEIGTPILMLTALAEVPDKVAGLSAGADDYLVKPFSIKELSARVDVLLRRPKKHIGPILRIGTLQLNTQTFSVSRCGLPIKLSSREYKLLNYLMYNQGQILSKDTLIAHVWDADAVILPNTIEVYIGYLRKKIDRDFPNEPPLIHTVFGFGYRIGE